MGYYNCKRKRDSKSKAVVAAVVTEEPPTTPEIIDAADDEVGLRLVLKKQKRQPKLLLKDSVLETRVLKFESASGASDYSEKKQDLEETLSWINSTGAAALAGCGRLDNYEKLEEISRGSFGAVYRARDKRSGEIVAMKEQLEGMSLQTLREIDILKSLERHPNIVEFKEVVTDGSGGVYVVMEYAEYDLHRYIKEFGLSAADIKAVMRQVLEGLKFLHENKIMHRDLKPTNILVASGGVLKICDFGLSRRFDDEEVWLYSPHVGTKGYRALELRRGQKWYKKEVDMWSLGCVMAEMLLIYGGGGDAEGRGRLEEISLIVEDAKGLQSGDDQLRAIFPAQVLSDAGFELLSNLLSWAPMDRMSADSALCDLWFEEEVEE